MKIYKLNGHEHELNLTKEEILEAIDKVSLLAKRVHITKKQLKADYEDGFDWESAWENEGVYILADKELEFDFDYGDTDSDGTFIDVNPLDNTNSIKGQLITCFNAMLQSY